MNDVTEPERAETEKTVTQRCTLRKGVSMKLSEVVKLTGLTKRTIYFYIEEKFLTPEINPGNGYYIFRKRMLGV